MEQSENVEVLSAFPSPYVARVNVALAYKGVAYKEVPQDLRNKGELLLKSNPVHKAVPVLLHDGKAVCESLNIVQYVDETWPSSGGANLLPADPCGRAEARFWADFVEKKVYDVVREAMMASAKGKDEEKKVAEEKVVAALSMLQERALVGEGPFFGGRQLGLVDVALGPLATWMPGVEELAQVSIPWSEKLPRLQATMAAFCAHPAASCLPEAAAVRDYISRVALPLMRQA